ncbi:uncharacterized protein C8Q71DRAFT_905313 [Rhodofomes roseus]|uniref:Uncharacterized protein n=1 Tax=Rhodofomes roseus TaxID=34475 RepID=A0ABQ8KNY7_9APHY|nr:uncharacterized protein C8Q71DRAFT_905313 [Rhodofomes roseus]KAH9839934.1 hypothetical protein C8Q71DRAFT_905313 [Rhodofomes roseus]
MRHHVHLKLKISSQIHVRYSIPGVRDVTYYSALTSACMLHLRMPSLNPTVSFHDPVRTTLRPVHIGPRTESDGARGRGDAGEDRRHAIGGRGDDGARRTAGRTAGRATGRTAGRAAGRATGRTASRAAGRATGGRATRQRRGSALVLRDSEGGRDDGRSGGRRGRHSGNGGRGVSGNAGEDRADRPGNAWHAGEDRADRPGNAWHAGEDRADRPADAWHAGEDRRDNGARLAGGGAAEHRGDDGARDARHDTRGDRRSAIGGARARVERRSWTG